MLSLATYTTKRSLVPTVAIACFLVVLAVRIALSQTEVEGAVSGVWDMDGSPYIVVDDIFVQARESLQIEPGVQVQFERGTRFEINGLLIAGGEEEDSIRFTSSEIGAPWFGLDIINADDETRLNYCVIDGGIAPEEWDDPEALGGGLYCERTNISVSNSAFRNNYANESGGGAYFDNSSPTLRNNVFVKNSADRDAGAIYFNECAGEFINNLVIENLAIRYSGGGVFLRGSQTRIANNRIFRNISGTQWGCGLYMDFNCTPEINRNLICQNSQGGVYMGVRCEPASFMHNTIADNAGRPGILLYINCRLSVRNCIIYGNNPTIWLVNGSRMWLDFSDVENPNLEGVTIGEGVIDQDPEFVNADELNYNLEVTSPCIDAGDPESPLDPDGSFADMGALPYHNPGEPEIIIDPEEIRAVETSEHVINIFNAGDDFLIWSIWLNEEWVTVEPVRGVLENDRDIDVFFMIDGDGFDFGVYESIVIIRSNDRERMEVEIPVTLRILRNLTASLELSWNMISINIDPREFYQDEDAEGPWHIAMFEELRVDGEHVVELLKDDEGRFWIPAWDDFTNIPYWDLTRGYQIKVNEAAEITWEGDPISAQADIPLYAGWNIIAYFPTYELDASAPDFYVLSPIIEHVSLACDDDGNFMIPAWGFSNMPPWRETQGYQVKVDEDVVLNYPEEPEDGASAFNAPPLIFPPAEQGGGDPSLPPGIRGESKGGASRPHWTFPKPTGRNMSVLITNIQNSKSKIQNSQIAAFSPDGRLVGAGTVDKDGRCGLAVWGDDPSTEEKDGLAENEAFELRYLDANEDKEIEMEVKAFHTGKGLTYETNSFLVIDVSRKAEIPQGYYLSQNYPNPFNNATRIRYGLPEAGHVSLKVYDISGRVVSTLIDSQVTAGHHVIEWDARQASSGLYLLQLEASNYKAIRKVVLAK